VDAPRTSNKGQVILTLPNRFPFPFPSSPQRAVLRAQLLRALPALFADPDVLQCVLGQAAAEAEAEAEADKAAPGDGVLSALLDPEAEARATAARLARLEAKEAQLDAAVAVAQAQAEGAGTGEA
jgi:hypothetical protein